VFLSRIRIANFKSLKDVEINSEGLVALVGPNGAGKTNFALAMKFLAEVHQHGLETAISRAGGIENIAYRKARRSKAPIEFEVEVRFDAEQIRKDRALHSFPSFPLGLCPSPGTIVVRHSFAFQACGGGIRAEFVVARETYRLEVGSQSNPKGLSETDSANLVSTIMRDQDGMVEVQIGGQSGPLRRRYRSGWRLLLEKGGRSKVRLGKQELLISSSVYSHRDWFSDALCHFLARIGVFHFSSDKIRDSGTPTPNPALTMPGGNLPALVDWLQRKDPKRWNGILDAMRDIVPSLEDITVQILSSKTLGLYFAEKGFGRPWRVDEVSDGTVHALSMLVAAADPRVSALVIEEPESSLHPWIIYELSKKLRELSKDKSIFITTHSPVLIDTLKPAETWIVSRQKGKTEIQRLTELAPDIEKGWSEGKVGLSEYLDSGLVPRAVPGGGL